MKVHMTPTLRELFSKLGKAGGKARTESLTKAERSEVARQGALARAKKYKTGELKYKKKAS